MKKIDGAISRLINKKDLSRKESRDIFRDILDQKHGSLNDIYFGSFFSAMQTKGPTEDEVAGLMDVVLNYDRIPIKVRDRKFCGIVGSGRDSLKTINVSTGAAIVASRLGSYIVKNGSRAESSVSGTTDVLEALGVNVKANPNDMKDNLLKNHLGFFDAGPYFPRMVKHYVGKFQFINPISYALSIASAVEFKRIVFGLADPKTEFTAKILRKLKFKHALITLGYDSTNKKFIDEISSIGKTKITELKNNRIKTYIIKPSDFGFKKGKAKEIAQHNTVKKNALHLLKILMGKIKDSSKDILSMNAGAALYASGKASNLKKGINLANEMILSGKTIYQLEKLVKASKGNIQQFKRMKENAEK